MKTNILITGVAGFIGNHLAKFYHNNGFKVIGLDVLEENKIINHYIDKYYQYNDKSIKINERLDICIHCAGTTSIINSVINPKNDFYSNVVFTFELLNYLKINSPECKFVFLSSAAVYGNPDRLPINEDHNILPISPYGFHKFQSEAICKEFYKCYSMKIFIVRIFSAYGPGLKRQVLWDICEKINKSIKIEMLGTGNEKRDFIYIDDIVNAIDLILKKSKNNEIYNLASGSSISIKDLVINLMGLFGVNKEICFNNNNPKSNPDYWQADISKLSEIGFKPEIYLENGLKNYVKWYIKGE